jgi:hypothetical protein
LIPLQSFWKSLRQAARSAAVCAIALVASKLAVRKTQGLSKRILASIEVTDSLVKVNLPLDKCQAQALFQGKRIALF